MNQVSNNNAPCSMVFEFTFTVFSMEKYFCTYFSCSDNVHSQLKHSLVQSLFIKSHLRISITSISKRRYTFLDVQPSIILVYQLNCFENSKMSNERGILTAHISFHCPSLACHMNVWKASNILALKFRQIIDGMNVLHAA